jgi:predicted RNA polymerase sigma factor
MNLRRLGRTEEAKKDIERALEIIAQNPHLNHMKDDFLDLDTQEQ